MIFSYLLNMQSHPSWVCGLKQGQAALMQGRAASHPSWVCGLKPYCYFVAALKFRSHPSWVCGLKPSNLILKAMHTCHTLRGCVDWNSLANRHFTKHKMSHPSWVCGLKLKISNTTKIRVSHTLRGCVDWNVLIIVLRIVLLVTPFVGVWIETALNCSCNNLFWVTPFVGVWIETGIGKSVASVLKSHTLRGCVDWNSWDFCKETEASSHTLRGCVDWNF